MYDNLRVNNEPYISMNGELICDEYLPENNPVNPPSSFGWFIYLVIGGGFDKMDEMTNTFINDCDIMSSTPNSLDRFYGASLNLPRPKITDNGNLRLLTDKEYAVYLYLRNCQLLTKLDLLTVFGHCMGDEDSDDIYHGVTISNMTTTHWHSVDHLNYASPDDDPSSNIARNSDTDLDYIINHDNDTEDVYTIPDELSYVGDYLIFVNVPYAGWSKDFLSFLTDYISIKGNVMIREVIQ